MITLWTKFLVGTGLSRIGMIERLGQEGKWEGEIDMHLNTAKHNSATY
jgi:hypothetical protein